jgi:hypothetical protein
VGIVENQATLSNKIDAYYSVLGPWLGDEWGMAAGTGFLQVRSEKNHAVMQCLMTGNFWRHPVTILHELGISRTNLLDVMLSI